MCEPKAREPTPSTKGQRSGVSSEEWSTSVELACGHSKVCAWSCGAKSTLLLLAQKIRSMEAVRAGRGLASSVSGAPCPLIHRSSSSRWHHHDRERILENDADVVPHDSLRCNTVFIRRDSHEETINRNANHTSDLVANQNRIQCSNEVGSSSFWSTFSAVRAKKWGHVARANLHIRRATSSCVTHTCFVSQHAFPSKKRFAEFTDTFRNSGRLSSGGKRRSMRICERRLCSPDMFTLQRKKKTLLSVP